MTNVLARCARGKIKANNMADIEEEILLQANLFLLLVLKRRQRQLQNRRKDRFWIRKIFMKRQDKINFSPIFSQPLATVEVLLAIFDTGEDLTLVNDLILAIRLLNYKCKLNGSHPVVRVLKAKIKVVYDKEKVIAIQRNKVDYRIKSRKNQSFLNIL